MEVIWTSSGRTQSFLRQQFWQHGELIQLVVKRRSQSRDRSPVRHFGRSALKHAISSIPPGAKVEAESLFEGAIRGLYRFDSSVWTEHDVFDRMDITVEVRKEPVTHTVRIEKLNPVPGP